MMCKHSLPHLRQDNVIIHLPSTSVGWEDDLKKLPQIKYSINTDSVAIESRAINNLRGSEAYQYSHRNKVRHILNEGNKTLSVSKQTQS